MNILSKAKADPLLDQLLDARQRLNEQELELRTANHRLKAVQAETERLRIQARTSQTLNLGIFSMLDQDQLYSLACESLVYQCGWDTALVVSLRANRTTVHASYGATLKQLDHARDYLAGDRAFLGLYGSHSAFSSYHTQSQTALAMRVLFQTDEVMAVPILFGERLYGYLVVCSHSRHGTGRPQEDLDFLATVGGQVAHAAQNSSTFKSLEQQNAKLRELDDLKNSFIAITSHQLRTPLSIVKWILSILQSDPKLVKLAEQLHLIDQAYESNERLIHVVNELLNVSRIQDGRLSCSPQPTDLGVLLHDVAANVEKTCRSRELGFTLSVEPELPQFSLDPLLFKEALQDLLDNAVDYNEPGGSVGLSARYKGGSAIIEISNTGEPIKPEYAQKLFEQFYRSPDAVQIKPDGNGLGLFLAKAIVREHGGDIAFKSRNHVTTFTISLPHDHGSPA